jgi:hypothetical protein
MASVTANFRSTCGSERGPPECSKQSSPGATPHVGHGTENNCFAVMSLILIWIGCNKTNRKAVPFRTECVSVLTGHSISAKAHARRAQRPLRVPQTRNGSPTHPRSRYAYENRKLTFEEVARKALGPNPFPNTPNGRKFTNSEANAKSFLTGRGFPNGCVELQCSAATCRSKNFVTPFISRTLRLVNTSD